MTPAELAAWEAEAAECAAAWTADVDRLGADLDAFPESRTLNRLAIRDHTGRVVGYSLGTDVLAAAWVHGAPAALIVEAERLAAVIGPRGSVGYLRRAVRLAHRVRALNRAVRRYSGMQSLPTVTVVARVDYLATVAADVADASLTTPTGSARAHAPPPLSAPAAISLRGPPRTVARLPLHRCAPAPAARPAERTEAVIRAA